MTGLLTARRVPPPLRLLPPSAQTKLSQWPRASQAGTPPTIVSIIGVPQSGERAPRLQVGERDAAPQLLWQRHDAGAQVLAAHVQLVLNGGCAREAASGARGAGAFRRGQRLRLGAAGARMSGRALRAWLLAAAASDQRQTIQERGRVVRGAAQAWEGAMQRWHQRGAWQGQARWQQRLAAGGHAAQRMRQAGHL